MGLFPGVEFGEILMCDHVSPLDQAIKLSSSAFVLGVKLINLLPEFDTQKPKVRPDTAGMSVLSVELAALGETLLD
jgi:hypothetical protein